MFLCGGKIDINDKMSSCLFTHDSRIETWPLSCETQIQLISIWDKWQSMVLPLYKLVDVDYNIGKKAHEGKKVYQRDLFT